MDSDLQDLAALASQVRKSLHWAAFLVVIMAIILVIDLQLKKSIGELAVGVARGQGQASHTQGGSPAGGDRDHGVVPDAGLAAGSDQDEGRSQDEAGGGVDGKTVRSRGDGRRTGGPQ